MPEEGNPGRPREASSLVSLKCIRIPYHFYRTFLLANCRRWCECIFARGNLVFGACRCVKTLRSARRPRGEGATERQSQEAEW